jgi:SAM-dependent methyltransferase
MRSRPPFYDSFAHRWHRYTGSKGGALKEFVLNEAILSHIEGIDGAAILEVGAGNGYFMPLLLRRFSGQVPARVCVTDVSSTLVRIAQQSFGMPRAEYFVLDITRRFPFEDASLDLILASMVWKEVPTAGLRVALRECYRVLKDGARLIATLMHPRFDENLVKRGLIIPSPKGPPQQWLFHAAQGMVLPHFVRPEGFYDRLFDEAKFAVTKQEVYANEQVLQRKREWKKAAHLPVALIYVGDKSA